MTSVTVDGGTATGDSIAAVGAYANTATFKDMDTVTATAGITGSVYTITGTTATTVIPGVSIQTIISTSSATTTISDPSAVTTSIVTGASTGAYSITPDVATTFTTIDATLSTAGAITVAAQAATNLAMAIQEGTASAATFTITGGNTGQAITVGGVTPSTTAHTFTSTALSIIDYTSSTGAQTITTGAGADTMTGGSGVDSYVIATAGDSMTVTTWTAGTSGSTITAGTALAAASTAAESWLGTYSSGTFTSSAGTDTLLAFYDGAAIEVIVLVGAATTLVPTAGVLVI